MRAEEGQEEIREVEREAVTHNGAFAFVLPKGKIVEEADQHDCSSGFLSIGLPTDISLSSFIAGESVARVACPRDGSIVVGGGRACVVPGPYLPGQQPGRACAQHVCLEGEMVIGREGVDVWGEEGGDSVRHDGEYVG